MKLSFTTLGCPNWTLKQIIENAAKMGFDAVDFRGLLEDIDISCRPEFTSQIKKTINLLRNYNIVVSAISTSARFAVVDKTEKKKHFDEAIRNLEITSKLDAHVMRVYGGQPPKGYTLETITPFLIENLRLIGDEAKKYDVTLAVETHDAWTNSEVLANIISKVNHPNVKVLWDLHHPYRFSAEPPEVTYSNIGQYTVGIHVKDSILDKNGKPQYVLLGEGTVPVKRMLDLLIQGGYQGYATLEWEKRWIPELLEPEIVFPQFIQKMHEWTD